MNVRWLVLSTVRWYGTPTARISKILGLETSMSTENRQHRPTTTICRCVMSRRYVVVVRAQFLGPSFPICAQIVYSSGPFGVNLSMFMDLAHKNSSTFSVRDAMAANQALSANNVSATTLMGKKHPAISMFIPVLHNVSASTKGHSGKWFLRSASQNDVIPVHVSSPLCISRFGDRGGNNR
jgi:hypothetical protein